LQPWEQGVSLSPFQLPPLAKVLTLPVIDRAGVIRYARRCRI
jgi:hypothetical protein